MSNVRPQERSSFLLGRYSICRTPQDGEATLARQPVRVVVDSFFYEKGIGHCHSGTFCETFDRFPSGLKQAQLSVINGSIRNISLSQQCSREEASDPGVADQDSCFVSWDGRGSGVSRPLV